MKTIKIGIIGLGTIGKGLYDAITLNSSFVFNRTGINLKIVGVCDKDEKALQVIDVEKYGINIMSIDDICLSDEIDIVVELIGGTTIAKDVIIKALKNKKHVVTANKALFAEYWEELFSIAYENNVLIKFEASVGGAIPIIKSLQESFVINNIDTIYGILNGTTNFILSMMRDKAYSFDKVLSIAQDKGIAEKDPDLDVSGKDSAHKLAILSLIGFGIKVTANNVYTEGITNLDVKDIENAKKWGYEIKLLAIAKKESDGVQLRVHPTLIKKTHLISTVNGVDNAIFIKGDFIEESLIIGKGAGSRPTASSVVSDIVDIAKNILLNKEEGLKYKLTDNVKEEKIKSILDLTGSYYLRFSVIDKIGVLSEISKILSKNNISIASVIQEERNENETVPLVILTHIAQEKDMSKAITEINNLNSITNNTVVIRIEE